MAAVEEHREFLAREGGAALRQARFARARQEFLELLKEGVFRHLLRQLEQDGRLAGILAGTAGAAHGPVLRQRGPDPADPGARVIPV